SPCRSGRAIGMARANGRAPHVSHARRGVDDAAIRGTPRQHSDRNAGAPSELRANGAERDLLIDDYFVTAFKVLPNFKVHFGAQFIRVYGTTAVNTGYYTFSFAQDASSALQLHTS